MYVKICGITSIEMANVVEENGANFIGFVFAPSKRQVSTEKAAEIANTLGKTINKVGVFVNETKENICHIAEQVGLDYIQLHGDETAAFATSLPYPVIKAFSSEKVTNELINHYPADYILIDSPPQEFRGGSGVTFDWSTLNQFDIDRSKLILAGGLTIDNVAQARAQVQPYAVDVSSGVETNGIKDAKKIEQFITLAKKDGSQ